MLRRGSETRSRHMVQMEAKLLNYGEAEILDGQLLIAAASAIFVDTVKGQREDRHAVFFNDKVLEDSQLNSECPLLAAYIGIFDGHDGPLASEYCCKGLLQHILVETEDCVRKNVNNKGKVVAIDGSRVASPLDAGVINAFHRAEARFAARSGPPTLEELRNEPRQEQAHAGKRCSLKDIFACLCCLPRKPEPKGLHGGTTALTLSIYGEKDRDGAYRPVPYVLIANTGDCRLLTDDGTGSENFRQITTDHRPTEPSEKERLQKFIQQRLAVVAKDEDNDVVRVHPGGLSVSRTVGDVMYSKAIICTPDVFRVPLTVSGDRRTHRFVLATDGVWDILSNETVGELAARIQESEQLDGAGSPEMTILAPHDAAARIMEKCLQAGGHVDDVTILVVDVTHTGKGTTDIGNSVTDTEKEVTKEERL